MSAFIRNAVADITGGRDTWRVCILFSLPAFMLAVAVALVRVGA